MPKNVRERRVWRKSLQRTCQPAGRPVTTAAPIGQNTDMRDVVHGAIGALIAYAVYQLTGHAVWSLAALALYVPIHLALRDRFPARSRDRAGDRS